MTQLSRYTLLDKIGSSVLGAVYKAHDTATGTPVALKVLQLGLLDDVSSREMDARLQREFEAAARLLHPGIARVFEIRRDGKTALIATELVDGPTVTSYLKATAGSDVSSVVTAAVQILEALDFAHSHAVIHRDLKPSNILVSQGTRIKITDFGMADLAARNRDDTGMLVGETQYMAPEQFLSGPIDKRCDIHAVGTILYELLTGKSPFAADAQSFAAMTKVLDFIPPPPSKVRSGLSPAFDRLVGRALAKSPAERFATAGQFRDELYAAYFALTRRPPPAILAPVPLTPDTPTPVARRTATIVQARPSSWSLIDSTPDGSATGTAPVRDEIDPLETAPLEPADESSASDSDDLKSALPRPAALATPDLTEKSPVGVSLLPGSFGSPLLPDRPSQQAKPLRASRNGNSAPLQAPAAQAPQRPMSPPPRESSADTSDASAAAFGGSGKPVPESQPPAATQYRRVARAPAGGTATPGAAALGVPVGARPAEPARVAQPEIVPAPATQAMRDWTPVSAAPATPPPMPAPPSAASPANPPQAIAADAAAVDPRARVGASPSVDVRPNPAPTRALPTPKRTIPLTDASIAHGGRVLARFVGPIAIVLSRRAAQDAHDDERAYFELLAAHLTDPNERTQFFREIRQRPL